MSDAMNNRKRTLEEEYFNRKNQEAIDRLREKIKVAAAAKTSGLSSMRCPRCDGNLKESQVDQVAIDTCEKCGGIWLDSGELGELLKRDKGGWFSKLWE
jgi:hypothetical protein